MIGKFFKGLIRSYAQSDDHAFDPQLKTRYYRMMKDAAWGEIIKVLKSLENIRFCFEMPKSGEIVVEKKLSTGRIQDITLTIVKTGPMETAVDIYCASRGALGDMGASERTVKQIFFALDKHFETGKQKQ